MVPNVAMEFQGYVYAETTNQQLRVVNALLDSLQKSDDFKKLFKNIKLVSTRNLNPVTEDKIHNLMYNLEGEIRECRRNC